MDNEYGEGLHTESFQLDNVFDTGANKFPADNIFPGQFGNGMGGIMDGDYSSAWEGFKETVAEGVKNLVNVNIDSHTREKEAETDAKVREIELTNQPSLFIPASSTSGPGVIEFIKANPVKTLVGALVLAKVTGLIK